MRSAARAAMLPPGRSASARSDDSLRAGGSQSAGWRRPVTRGTTMATRTRGTATEPGHARPRGGRPGDEMGVKVAHELRNPLTGVKALVQLGLRNPAERASHTRLAIVEKELARMQEILNRYLSSTRPLEEVRPARVELGALVSETVALLSARASEARVRLLARGDAAVDADPRRMKEALLNLVANAIEATPPGGQVIVEVRPSGDEAEIVVR